MAESVQINTKAKDLKTKIFTFDHETIQEMEA